MATVSYGLKITEAYHIFDKTIAIYRNAVHYISDIAMRHYDELKSLESITGNDGKVIVSAQQRRQQKMERLIHSTANNDATYKRFDKEFYKFPSYLRRDAINTAIGLILSYRSQLQKWEDGGKHGRRPYLNRNQSTMPCFYRNNTFLDSEETNIVSLKLYNGKDWIWETFVVRDCDFMYAYNHMKAWKASAPVLTKRNHRARPGNSGR